MENTVFAGMSDLAVVLKRAERVAVLTGAGISRDSGLRTFREPGTGLWAEYNPEEICTPQAFHRNPGLVWEWHEHQRSLVEQARPNAAHLALAELERYVASVTVITQNFDGLHQEAGSTRVLELHGNIRRVRCSREWTLVDTPGAGSEVPPRCPSCGAFLRHEVVWFGESLPPQVWEEAIDATASCDVFLSIGTSGVVQPAASLPDLAYSAGASVAYVNLDVEPGVYPPVYHICGGASEVLPALLQMAWG